LAHGDDAGVVDEHIDTAKPQGCGGHHLVDRRSVVNIRGAAA
jgi:hypothetical protein